MNWDNLQRVLEEYSAFLDTTAKGNIPSEWRLKSSISFDLEVGNNLYEITFRAPEYWKYANYGRRPGKMPPVSEIEKWVIRRRISPRATANGKVPSTTSLAYLIARKIGRDGVKGSDFLNKTLSDSSQQWEERITAAIVEDISGQLEEWMSPTNEYIHL